MYVRLRSTAGRKAGHNQATAEARAVEWSASAAPRQPTQTSLVTSATACLQLEQPLTAFAFNQNRNYEPRT